jgi:hypothetical protein
LRLPDRSTGGRQPAAIMCHRTLPSFHLVTTT